MSTTIPITAAAYAAALGLMAVALTVQSIEQLKRVLQGKPKSVALLVQRDGEKIFVPVNLG